MPDSNSSLIIVQHVDVEVKIDDSDSSSTSIWTSALGPCICIMAEFFYTKQNTRMCIIDHYSIGFDEKKLSSKQRLNWLLDYILNMIKVHLC
jgi:hypothetical protein